MFYSAFYSKERSVLAYFFNKLVKNAGSTGCFANFCIIVGFLRNSLSSYGSSDSPFINKLIRFSSIFGSPRLRARASSFSSSGSYNMGDKFLRSIFLLFRTLEIIISFLFDFYLKSWSTTDFGRSLATLLKLVASSNDYSPSILFNNYLFWSLSPPIFFIAFRDAYLAALSGWSLSSSFILFASIPLSPVSNEWTNYLLNFELLSNSCLTI